ncbi:MAG: hypothetical protein LBG22_06050 [Treponema sp.]|jgi:hypothetical protein|nr:hypothetical protein [Treponema sp.]
MHKKLFLLLSFLSLFLVSCIGVKAGISIDAEGKGRILLEYRILREFESLGRLDGNEAWPIIPAGKADLERSLKRLPGMKLKAFSQKDEGNDTLIHAEMEFSSVESLLPFLDAWGERALYQSENGKKRLSLCLNPGGKLYDPQLIAIFKRFSEDYVWELSLTAPGTVSLEAKDGKGNPLAELPGEAKLEENGKKARFSIAPAGILSAENGLTLDFSW